MFDLFKKDLAEKNETFVDVFIINAQKYPNKVAVVDDDGSYTYRELNQISNGVAAKLLKQGIGNGDIVPILVQRGKGFVAAFLGVMKTGAAFVPLDVSHPIEKIRSICEDVEAKMIINDSWMKSISYCNEAVNNAKLEEIALIVFTSGSTNKPKGVIHTHKSVLAMANLASHFCQSKTIHHYSTVLGCDFIGGMHDYVSCIAIGATLFVAPNTIRKDATALAKWLCNNNIDVTHCIPFLGKLLLENFDLPLKNIEIGGEKMCPIKKSSAKISYQYGCSEFAPPAIINNNVHPDEPTPIGKPIVGVDAFIVLENDILTKGSEIGELCLVGPQMALGYWKMPELTSEKFVHCPFLPGDVTMYKTGDLARYREDGNIELVGRKDFQIKIRGYRIEPGEIENVALRFEGIDTVVVVAKEIGEEKHLVLYYTSNVEIEKDKLREYLSRFLADYMVPYFYVHLDEMPRNANGKIDRSALPVPPLAIDNLPSKEQITRIEHSLLDEIKKELHLQDLGLDDDLLSLGFTSLSSMFVQTRLEQKGINFSSGGIEAYKVFLEFRTIRKVANYLENDNNKRRT